MPEMKSGVGRRLGRQSCCRPLLYVFRFLMVRSSERVAPGNLSKCRHHIKTETLGLRAIAGRSSESSRGSGPDYSSSSTFSFANLSS